MFLVKKKVRGPHPRPTSSHGARGHIWPALVVMGCWFPEDLAPELTWGFINISGLHRNLRKLGATVPPDLPSSQGSPVTRRIERETLERNCGPCRNSDQKASHGLVTTAGVLILTKLQQLCAFRDSHVAHLGGLYVFPLKSRSRVLPVPIRKPHPSCLTFA